MKTKIIVADAATERRRKAILAAVEETLRLYSGMLKRLAGTCPTTPPPPAQASSSLSSGADAIDK